MDIKKLGLTEIESRILKRCADAEVTRRRMRQVLLVATVFAMLLLAMAWYSRSLPLVLAVALLYIAVTTWEKLAYGRAVISYKAIITKLVRRLGDLDGDRGRDTI
jgi:hypothetical protein